MKFVAVFLACSLMAAQGSRPAPAKSKPVVKTEPAAAAAKPEAPPAAKEPAKVAKDELAKPAAKSETLRFTVNWPSGLSLGEGQVTSTLENGEWAFAFNVEAAIPGFAVAEGGSSKSSPGFCSTELTKKATRGKRQTEEQTIFNKDLTATRTTLLPKGGGKSDLKTTSCPKDALTFIHFLRHELAAGRLPAAQPVYYGAGYQTRVQYKGTQHVRAGAKMVEADILVAHIKGPAAEFEVDLFFARDAARTPLMAQVPVAVGKFTVEFSR